MPYITTPDSTEIYYCDWGTGSPIVLIHGWPLNGDMWEQQAVYLVENGARVITYDRRGFGRSGQPWTGHDYNTYAADLAALIEQLDLRNVTLAGFSMGGGEVVRYLSLYGSARVSKAVLISAVTPFLLKTNDNPEGIDGKVFADIEAAIRKDRPAFLQEFGPMFYGRSMVNHTVSQGILEWTQSMALTASLLATLAAAQAWSGTDFREDLRSIQIPVRIIHGTSDATVPIEQSGVRSAGLIANSTLTEYDGEPHGLFITAADRLNQELLAIVRS